MTSQKDESGSDRNAQDDASRPREHNRDRIARRAYERYEARGRSDGGDVDDWLRAEQDLATTRDDSNQIE